MHLHITIFITATLNTFCSVATGLNTGPAQRLTIRYTTDDWKTYHDEEAMHMEAGTGFADRYIATLHCPVDESCNSIKFAARYEAAGREFWDNNGGRDYSISISSA